ncbi:YcxB family protein [Nonomuraea rhodomycinica]|uniref:YcxB family protein n=1 Tax=Nonomuraea rhodomycinica TaxID=1712872 RepID=A0A7Y6IXV5_9ACTN|nr:YcxB family protein [Nonomuraea rhodomycinica]NUW46345.1 YcxB family protein [Nonomuraea rhodomycinica]
MDFTIDYTPTQDEVARAFGQGLRRQLSALRVALPAILVLAGAACAVMGGIGLAVGMFAGAVAFPVALTWAIRRAARRQLAYLCVPTTLRVTGQGYECRTDQYTTTLNWSMFGNIVTTPEFWLFFIGKQCAAFLPRRAFDSDQQAALDALFAARPATGTSVA